MPTEYPFWSVSLQYEDRNINGLNLSFPNRATIPTPVQLNGALYGESIKRQWINQALYLSGKWIEHLDKRYSTGTVITTTSSENATQISERLGGTWFARGTDTLGTETVNVFEKLA